MLENCKNNSLNKNVYDLIIPLCLFGFLTHTYLFGGKKKKKKAEVTIVGEIIHECVFEVQSL